MSYLTSEPHLNSFTLRKEQDGISRNYNRKNVLPRFCHAFFSASSPASGNGLSVYPRLGGKFSRAWYQLQVFLHLAAAPSAFPALRTTCKSSYCV